MTAPTENQSSTGPTPLPPMQQTSIPERRSFRFKSKMLGRALTTDQLEHERLSNSVALAVFSSDALSSTAYASEEILLTLLVAGVGSMAFNLVLPITIAMVLVLTILVFSYRQTIKAYPSAGGAYIVTKDNLGVIPAQVAGVALLTDYILTVSVSVSAGVAALYSVFHGVYPYRVPIALGFIAIIAIGNLRGVKESGKIFAIPTYAFLISMFLMIGVGIVKATLGGGLDHVRLDPIQAEALATTGAASFVLILHAFASGGAAVTGVEAISNGVPAFKAPEWKNARNTLMVMGIFLGMMFLGISWLAGQVHAVPMEGRTVISQIAETVYGNGVLGKFLFIFTQASTMFILVLAANTSFADFPRLASFQAEDSFMPRQLTKRGHRLVFSNGIIALAISAAVLVVILGADVSKLIPLYAVGVFTSFTLSQAGMARRHIRLKEQGWKVGLFINGLGAIVTLVVTVVIAYTKFTHGAWVIIVLIPIFVWVVVRLNHQYEAEKAELEGDAILAATAPILRRHAVVVLIDKIDRTSARAIQYARTLHPDRLWAVHIAVDEIHASELADEWSALALKQLPLDIRECPDRRINRTVLEVVHELAADGDTEVSILIPRREYRSRWHRLLHDHTADGIAKAISDVPHANVTFVPYHLTKTSKGQHIHKIEHGAVSGTSDIHN
ncbi:MAG: amino acid permease [Actinobacteria bacterium]|nr:amino acid permease [Actinomycetota bacterium]MSW32876.1 amino acid permease [Actinomycetota bacterium]MSX34175.1 amino acid permease [Actinomycetota bacterium]MSY25869.1 amino acid permease [Actinomycetota bacterium]MSY33758.1 amino acid permease [Actinomycetota bacterium]